MPVARDLHRRSRMTARRREGREARTDWRVRLRLGAFTLVEANLHTGRTHQIRVHFSALGCPVVGDTVYGAPRQNELARGSFHRSAEISFMPRASLSIIRAPASESNSALLFRRLSSRTSTL